MGHGLAGAPWAMLSLYPMELPTIRKPPAGLTHPAGSDGSAPPELETYAVEAISAIAMKAAMEPKATRRLAFEDQRRATRKLTPIISSREGMRYSSKSWTVAGPTPTKNSRIVVLTEPRQSKTNASMRRRYLPSRLFL